MHKAYYVLIYVSVRQESVCMCVLQFELWLHTCEGEG